MKRLLRWIWRHTPDRERHENAQSAVVVVQGEHRPGRSSLEINQQKSELRWLPPIVVTSTVLWPPPAGLM